MQLKNLLKDDDAVSPVIGVILMVAITVILAAVIASFVLGLGDSQDVAPNTNFQWDYDQGDELTIQVSGGDSVQAAQLDITGEFDGLEAPEEGEIAGSGSVNWFEETDETRLSAGSSITFDDEEGDAATEYDLSVVWTSEDGDTSSTLSSNSGPDA